MNIPSYNALLNRDRQIKTIQELCENIDNHQNPPTKLSELTNDVGFVTKEEIAEGEVTIISNQEMPASWLTAGNMRELIEKINQENKAKAGTSFLATMHLSDLPTGLMQAEVKAEVLSSEGLGKVILFTVTSENVSPYHWEYTSAYGRTGQWRAFLTDSEIQKTEQEIKDTNTDLYNLKKIVGSLGGNVTYEIPNALGTSFNTLMNNNGTVKLTSDLSTGRYGPGILASNKVILDLNNHNLTIDVSDTTAAIQARGTQELTIKGKGILNAGSGMAVMANGKDAVITLSGSTTTYQTNRPGAELIYCYAGTINISGGTYKNNGSPYLLNCYDANYQNGTAKIIVTGGKFYDFDPGNNRAEGENTSFLAEGYKSTASTVVEEGVEHTVYTVSKL